MSDIWHDPLFLSALKKGGAGGSVSGDIVTFNAPKAAPLRSLTLGIDPIQDLHGYDAPWPGGGGINLLDISIASPLSVTYGLTKSIDSSGFVHLDGIVDGTGEALSIAVIRAGDAQIDALTGKNYVISMTDVSGGTVKSAWGLRDIDNGAIACSITNPGNGTEMHMKFRVVVATTKQTSFSPYSNLCPISGWAGAQVWRTGRNLVNVTPTLDGNRYVTFFGNHSVGDATTGIFLKAGTYTLSVSNPQGVNVGVYGCYLDDHAQITISGNGTQTTKTGTLTLTKDRVLNFWLFFNVAGANYTDGITVQLELGTTPTPYTPYTGTTIPVTFTEAGTVYGGVWDVLNGVLTVDRAKYTIDSTTPIAQIADNRDGNLRIKYASGIPAYKVRASGICSAFPVITTETAYNYAPSNCVFYSNGVFVMPPAGVEHTEQAYLQWLTSVGAIEVVMELATPITIPLTPQEISTLAGQNVVWGDAGEVSLEYAGGGVSKDMMLAAILHEARQ